MTETMKQIVRSVSLQRIAQGMAVPDSMVLPKVRLSLDKLLGDTLAVTPYEGVTSTEGGILQQESQKGRKMLRKARVVAAGPGAWYMEGDELRAKPMEISVGEIVGYKDYLADEEWIMVDGEKIGFINERDVLATFRETSVVRLDD